MDKLFQHLISTSPSAIPSANYLDDLGATTAAIVAHGPRDAVPALQVLHLRTGTWFAIEP